MICGSFSVNANAFLTKKVSTHKIGLFMYTVRVTREHEGLYKTDNQDRITAFEEMRLHLQFDFLRHISDVT